MVVVPLCLSGISLPTAPTCTVGQTAVAPKTMNTRINAEQLCSMLPFTSTAKALRLRWVRELSKLLRSAAVNVARRSDRREGIYVPVGDIYDVHRVTPHGAGPLHSQNQARERCLDVFGVLWRACPCVWNCCDCCTTSEIHPFYVTLSLTTPC